MPADALFCLRRSIRGMRRVGEKAQRHEKSLFCQFLPFRSEMMLPAFRKNPSTIIFSIKIGY
ncbi:hypothetical protein [uncultured Mailhella sp.]|uniref:hypothetical protein n=1 Tax=uncultured Mailhella sp. TaxID=1981031 RepID=UPI0025DBDAD2|nr:hypothetical protein [uncultured Mailhella sp.]